jgi:hypothetical protein
MHGTAWNPSTYCGNVLAQVRRQIVHALARHAQRRCAVAGIHRGPDREVLVVRHVEVVDHPRTDAREVRAVSTLVPSRLDSMASP